jgi:rhomboid protease GluP
MEIKTYIKSNWLTTNPKRDGLTPTLVLMSLLLFSSFIYLNKIFNAPLWMSATFDLVFNKHEWWRAWTAILAHGNLGHIGGNFFLFFPFSYYLIAYFGYFFFPVFGFFTGGILNLIVLQMMPSCECMIGVSGVVNWMGGAWVILAWLIDRRESHSKRILKAVIVTMILFVSDSFKPEVGYLGHSLGYLLGILNGIIFYYIFKRRIEAEIVLEHMPDNDDYVWGPDLVCGNEENKIIDQPTLSSPCH